MRERVYSRATSDVLKSLRGIKGARDLAIRLVKLAYLDGVLAAKKDADLRVADAKREARMATLREVMGLLEKKRVARG